MEDFDSGKKENTNDIQIQDCPDGSDLHLDENQEEVKTDSELQLDRNHEDNVVLRGEPKPSNAMKSTYNVQVNNASNVVIGDNSLIIVQQSELVKNLRIVNGVATVVPGDVDEEAQITAQTVDKNITVNNPCIMVIGDGTVTNVMPKSNFCLGEASNLEQSVRMQLFRLPSDPLVLSSPGIHPELKNVFDIMRLTVDQLYPLRDSGKMQEFEKAFNRLHSRYKIHPAIKSFLLLEESTNLTYQKRFKAAKRKAEESLNIVNHEASEISGALQDVLRVLANVALASIFRRLPKKKLGKAFNCLEDARQSSERLTSVNLTMPKFALALLDYEQARCYMEFGTVKSESKTSNKEAYKLLGLCIDRCKALANENQLYTAKQTFALVCLARLSLSNSTGYSEPGQRKKVTKQCARQAEKHLEEYQRSHLRDSPPAVKVKYFITRSELCFLKRNYASAKDFGYQAVDIAVEYGLELEIVPAQNHVEQISSYSGSSTMRQEKLPRVKNLSSYYISSTTTDSDQKYTFTGSQRAT